MPLTRIAVARRQAGRIPEGAHARASSARWWKFSTCRRTTSSCSITEHEAGNFIYDKQYLNIERSDDSS